MSISSVSADYIPISVSTLVPSTMVGIELFQQDPQSDSYALYRGGDYPLQDGDLQRLRSRGIKKLFIRKLDQGSYQRYLREMIDNPQADAPIAARTGALNDVVRDLLGSAFQTGDADASVMTAAYLGDQTADIICNDEFTGTDLFRVLHHDYATFTHSTNVAFYCGMLAAELGFNKPDISLIVSGGLLHDLGKLEIDDRILNKPGRLDELEFREIQNIPRPDFVSLHIAPI
ncbi:MAG: HD domain-containing protein [Pirellulaceae bacterium]